MKRYAPYLACVVGIAVLAMLLPVLTLLFLHSSLCVLHSAFI
jgi:hypothetical protein